MPCVVDLATMREADARPRRRPGQDQPAGARPSWSSTTRSSPTCSAARTPSSATSSSSTSATTSATSSCAGARPRSTSSRSSRPAPASCTRSTSSTWPASCSTARRQSPTPTPGRHRLAHHDGQRPRRARLGRRRHRGRGGDARPAGVDAHPARRRLQAHRRAARGRHRHRPGAHHHRDAAQARRGRQVRRVLRRRRRRGAAGQPRHHRQHEPGVRLHLRDLPDRRRDPATTCGSPAAPAEQVALVEAYAKAQGLWHDPAAEPVFSEYLELDLVAPSCRRIAGPKRPQDRVALSDAKAGVPRRRSPTTSTTTGGRPDDEAAAESFPASDPPAPATATPADRTRRDHGDRQPAAQPGTVTLDDGTEFELDHGAVVIAAITSCTNTSNP